VYLCTVLRSQIATLKTNIDRRQRSPLTPTLSRAGEREEQEQQQRAEAGRGRAAGVRPHNGRVANEQPHN
jgi:hypothetical protein